MPFIDEVEIRVVSGRGGDGCVSFRREKYVPYGGPDGGDGGWGGSVIFRADEGVTTLHAFRGQRVYKAEPGMQGGIRQCTGRCGRDLVLSVPCGTMVRDRGTGELLADLREHGAEVVLARGGAPGKGNMAFRSSTNRTPRESTPGGVAEEKDLLLELRLLADVGVVGFPNAGKSTLVSRVSAARPRIADYPFTTLVPHLGVVDRGVDGGFVIADVPGLIEGAADGAGLGHRFLRHVQRTRLLLHLVAVVPEEAGDAVRRYRVLRRELERFDPDLALRPEVVVLTKVDAVDPTELEAAQRALEAEVGRPVWLLSAVTGAGLKPLMDHVWTVLQGGLEGP